MKLLNYIFILCFVIVITFTNIKTYAISSPSVGYIAKNSKINGYDPVSYFGVLDPSNGNFQHYRGDSAPLSLASIVKVPVALAVLDDLDSGKYTLSSAAILPSWASGDGSAGTTVLENLKRMLGPSDNSATNALIVKAGGLDQVTAKVRKYGLNNTSINCLLSPQSINYNTCRSKNVSTMRDLVKSMDIIRTRNTANSKAIINPMITTSYTYNHTGRVFNKCGLNSKSLGDIGVFQVTANGATKQYVYAAVVDFPNGDGAYYDSRTEPLAGKIATTSLSEKRDPISKATQWLINDLSQGFELTNGAL